MTGIDWDWVLIGLVGLIVAASVVVIGAWLWGEADAAREEREEIQRRLREPAPRLRVLPGGES